MSTLAFRNMAQVVLFKNELAGQISDGYWENSRPLGHWKPWGACQVIVDASNPGKDFWAQKENYNFANRELLDIVGDRMIYAVRVALALGPDVQKLCGWAIEGGKLSIPSEAEAAKSTYWAEVRERLLTLDADAVNKALADESRFSKKDLTRELKDMKQIIRMSRKP
jgi:hypothetical protein